MGRKLADQLRVAHQPVTPEQDLVTVGDERSTMRLRCSTYTAGRPFSSTSSRLLPKPRSKGSSPLTFSRRDPTLLAISRTRSTANRALSGVGSRLHAGIGASHQGITQPSGHSARST